MKATFWKFLFFTYRLFVCQDEDENEPEDEFFRSFRIKTVTNEPGPQYYDTLKDRFVRHAQVPERTKALVFVFVFVFVLAHEQAMSQIADQLLSEHEISLCLKFMAGACHRHSRVELLLDEASPSNSVESTRRPHTYLCQVCYLLVRVFSAIFRRFLQVYSVAQYFKVLN